MDALDNLIDKAKRYGLRRVSDATIEQAAAKLIRLRQDKADLLEALKPFAYGYPITNAHLRAALDTYDRLKEA